MVKANLIVSGHHPLANQNSEELAVGKPSKDGPHGEGWKFILHPRSAQLVWRQSHPDTAVPFATQIGILPSRLAAISWPPRSKIPRMSGRRAILVLIVLLLSGSAVVAETPNASVIEHFEKKIRPLLVQYCFDCHGFKKAKGGLRLNSRTPLSRGAIPGPPCSSPIWMRVVLSRRFGIRMKS